MSRGDISYARILGTYTLDEFKAYVKKRHEVDLPKAEKIHKALVKRYEDHQKMLVKSNV